MSAIPIPDSMKRGTQIENLSDQMHHQDGELVAPDWLDGDAQEEWQRVVRELAPLRILSSLDQTTLAVYCSIVSNYRFVGRKVKAEGIFLVNTDGASRENPALKTLERLSKQILGYAAHFGLSPHGRGHLKVSRRKSKIEDDFDSFVGKK